MSEMPDQRPILMLPAPNAAQQLLDHKINNQRAVIEGWQDLLALPGYDTPDNIAESTAQVARAQAAIDGIRALERNFTVTPGTATWDDLYNAPPDPDDSYPAQPSLSQGAEE